MTSESEVLLLTPHWFVHLVMYAGLLSFPLNFAPVDRYCLYGLYTSCHPETVQCQCQGQSAELAVQNIHRPAVGLFLFPKMFQHLRGITIKFANSSRQKCYIPHCWIPPWSPSKYAPWKAMHRCQHLVHPSNFGNGFVEWPSEPDVTNVIKMPSFQ